MSDLKWTCAPGEEAQREYTLILQFANYQEGKQLCAEQFGTFAIVTDAEENEVIIQLLEDSNLREDAWIGVEDPTDQGGQGTERFFYVDPNVTNRSFFNNGGDQVPWSNFDPGDVGGIENCGAMRNGLWIDSRCDRLALVLCSRPCNPVPSKRKARVSTLLVAGLVGTIAFVILLGLFSRSLSKRTQRRAQKTLERKRNQSNSV